ADRHPAGAEFPSQPDPVPAPEISAVCQIDSGRDAGVLARRNTTAAVERRRVMKLQRRPDDLSAVLIDKVGGETAQNRIGVFVAFVIRSNVAVVEDVIR